MNGAKILAGIAGETWVMTQAKLEAMMAVIERRMEGVRLDDEQIKAALEGVSDFDRDEHRTDFGGVAVLSLTGIMSQKANLVTRFSGGTSTQQFASIFQEALADRKISTIILNCDSPGGSVYGVAELADVIYAARGGKRVVAVADPVAASGAYWVASAASELYVTPSGEVGSVGAFAVHVEESKRLERVGIKYTIVRAGENKARFNSVEPLEGRALKQAQDGVDRYRDLFVAALVRHRAGSSARPPADFGAGLMFGAADAVRVGMADGVATFQAVLDREIERIGARSGLANARGQFAMAALES